jgi:hypothetical protein
MSEKGPEPDVRPRCVNVAEVPLAWRLNVQSRSNRPLPAVEGAHFSGLISEVGPGEWRAFAWVRKPDQTLEQTIGPQTLATAAASHGFENFDIVVERLTDEDLVAEDDA